MRTILILLYCYRDTCADSCIVYRTVAETAAIQVYKLLRLCIPNTAIPCNTYQNWSLVLNMTAVPALGGLRFFRDRQY